MNRYYFPAPAYQLAVGYAVIYFLVTVFILATTSLERYDNAIYRVSESVLLLGLSTGCIASLFIKNGITYTSTLLMLSLSLLIGFIEGDTWGMLGCNLGITSCAAYIQTPTTQLLILFALSALVKVYIVCAYIRSLFAGNVPEDDA